MERCTYLVWVLSCTTVLRVHDEPIGLVIYERRTPMTTVKIESYIGSSLGHTEFASFFDIREDSASLGHTVEGDSRLYRHTYPATG